MHFNALPGFMTEEKKNNFTTSQQEIWKNRIRSELSWAKEWESNWGFLVERKEVPDEESCKSVVTEELDSSASLQEARLV